MWGWERGYRVNCGPISAASWQYPVSCPCCLAMFFFYLFIYFWLCWVLVSVRGLSPVAASGGHSSSRCAGLSLSRPLLLRSTGSRRAGSVIVAHGPSCPAACGILPDQGSNPCPLHWQADSQPLRHQGSPSYVFNCLIVGIARQLVDAFVILIDINGLSTIKILTKLVTPAFCLFPYILVYNFICQSDQWKLVFMWFFYMHYSTWMWSSYFSYIKELCLPLLFLICLLLMFKFCC